MEVDIISSLAGREESPEAVLEESWLQEEPFARALGVTRHAHTIRVNERLDWIRSILDANVSQFGGAHLPLYHLDQALPTLLR